MDGPADTPQGTEEFIAMASALAEEMRGVASGMAVLAARLEAFAEVVRATDVRHGTLAELDEILQDGFGRLGGDTRRMAEAADLLVTLGRRLVTGPIGLA